MESDEDDEETQASFCRFFDDNFKLPISAYAPGCISKVEFKERLLYQFDIDRCSCSQNAFTVKPLDCCFSSNSLNVSKFIIQIN